MRRVALLSLPAALIVAAAASASAPVPHGGHYSGSVPSNHRVVAFRYDSVHRTVHDFKYAGHVLFAHARVFQHSPHWDFQGVHENLIVAHGEWTRTWEVKGWVRPRGTHDKLTLHASPDS